MAAKRFLQGWLAGLVTGVVLGTTWLAGAESLWGPWVPILENGFYSGNEYRELGYCRYAYVSGVYDAVWMIDEVVRAPRAETMRWAFEKAGELLPADDGARWKALDKTAFPHLLGPTARASTFGEIRANLDEMQGEGKEKLELALDLAESYAQSWELFTVSRDFILPRGVTNVQLTDVVNKYVEEHPEERHLSAAWLVWKAVAEAFHGAK